MQTTLIITGGRLRAAKQIIQTIYSHTLTVVSPALSLSASGMDAEILLYELQTRVLGISSGEAVELYEDGNYIDGLMADHLRKLLQLGKLYAIRIVQRGNYFSPSPSSQELINIVDQSGCNGIFVHDRPP